ncbi:GspH/FimT family pseudopilin [Pseudoxanthomonas sp. SE1]|uniref:type II secretion system protein XpsH n=1 Tax=Pseudoxanthomonas sp. SE1 TaxID=1664560 RepID=UPI00240E73C9|nr:GspH/FimT family pseudopilin [Pseudoxanthomonas sp. SE1]WFC43835.1 GspH/FimT family pseudopilin [Pseudoxanthomonas sp. SE1]
MDGFTLLETLLVMTLMAAATLLAAMMFTGGMEGMRLRSESKEIAAQLRYTRARAIATGQPQRFLVDPRAHRWEAAGDRHGDIDASLSVRFTGARQAQARAGEGAILFFPDGGSTGGRVTLVAGQAAWSADVAWLTGEVRLVRDAVAAR